MPTSTLSEESEKATRPCCLASVVHQHLSVPLAYGDKKLVNGHGRVYGNFATEEVLDVMLLYQSGIASVRKG